MVGSLPATPDFDFARERVDLVAVAFDAAALFPAALVLVPVAFFLSSDFAAFVARVRFVTGLVSFSTVAVAVFLARLRVVFGACSELEPEVTAVSPRIWAQDTPLRSRGVTSHLSTGTPDTQTQPLQDPPHSRPGQPPPTSYHGLMHP